MPQLTFAMHQVVMGRRCGPWAALADLHESTYHALVALGFTPSSPILIADADLAGLRIDQIPTLFDITEWRMLETIANNLSEDDLKKVGVMDDPERVRIQVRQRSDRIFSRVQREHGIGLPTLQVGVVSLNFQQQDDAGTIDF